MAVHVGSSSEWRQILQSTIVVADFHADWCGPCKAIAPTFESLATKFSKPKRITFAKINVDNQREIASQYGVRAMPTFMIFKNGSAIETLQGPSPPALTAAIEKAVKLAGPAAGGGFSVPGRTLGGSGPAGQSRQSLRRPIKWDLNNFLNAIINFFGLYLVSLFTFDPYKAAEASKYNVHNPVAPAATPNDSATGGAVKKPAPKATFRTLADLGGD
ncbi:37s ribosomal protein rsm22 [Diaporthe amygdali]|uniref:37s ribosomal protein rsm22 n=1 Tax=Phomopsis amygdali TaxID=1214568 RepID=UPI0022FE81E6|nr:37s ribosomal protein rsm22 [Diaporthe amygdali]KAJ0123008.1 37s ribosomal protein rsm22 [Diaporthe amygdali]